MSPFRCRMTGMSSFGQNENQRNKQKNMTFLPFQCVGNTSQAQKCPIQSPSNLDLPHRNKKRKIKSNLISQIVSFLLMQWSTPLISRFLIKQNSCTFKALWSISAVVNYFGILQKINTNFAYIYIHMHTKLGMWLQASWDLIISIFKLK